MHSQTEFTDAAHAALMSASSVKPTGILKDHVPLFFFLS